MPCFALRDPSPTPLSTPVSWPLSELLNHPPIAVQLPCKCLEATHSCLYSFYTWLKWPASQKVLPKHHPSTVWYDVIPLFL